MGTEIDRPLKLDGTDPLPRVGDVVGGKYMIERLLARGGMGAVFAARHVVTDKTVALKWLLTDLEHDSEASLRLIREAKVAARVSHTNVVDVYDVGEHQGSLFLVMEYLHGHTLSEHLATHRRLPLHETLALLVPVMRGIAAAHRQGVIHRDLKPSNIFLGVDPDTHEVVPCVLDFGISKVSERLSGTELSQTRSGTLLGTPYYMSPEQLAGASTLDARADIYALGVILYQALSGSLPFSAQTVSALAIAVVTREPTPLTQHNPELPARVSHVVAKAMARDASQRYRGVDDLIEALEAAARAHDKPAHRTAAIALLCLAIAIVAGSWLIWSKPRALRRSPQDASTNAQPTAAAHNPPGTASMSMQAPAASTVDVLPASAFAPNGARQEPAPAPLPTRVTAHRARTGEPHPPQKPQPSTGGVKPAAPQVSIEQFY